MNRRGYLFSVLALIVIVIAVALIQMKAANQDIQQSGLHSHILSANAFLLQFEEDLPRVIDITGYRAMLGMEEHISATGLYIDNLSDTFSQVIMNGSINGTSYAIMDDATLEDFLLRMQEISSRLGMDVNLSIINISLAHTSPWVVQVNMTVIVNATTRDNSTMWNYAQPMSSSFTITDLKDPLYTVGTLGRVPAPIKPVNITRPYITATNDTSKLEKLWNETMYVEDDQAPSFLMRFQGNFSASEYGITSLVDTKLLDAQDIAVHTDRSVVDFIYFHNVSSSTNNIVNMSSFFLLDDEHLELFDAEDKVI